jgi:hypothetical protein
MIVNSIWITFKSIKSTLIPSDFPFFALAPMADVTDVAFRTMFAKYGKPDVTWTEFVSADGLSSPGREVLKRDLEFTEAERPVVAQIFGNNPDNIRNAVRLCKELGFDGVDINMGCPVDAIGRQGAGAALIKNPVVARAVRNGNRSVVYPPRYAAEVVAAMHCFGAGHGRLAVGCAGAVDRSGLDGCWAGCGCWMCVHLVEERAQGSASAGKAGHCRIHRPRGVG